MAARLDGAFAAVFRAFHEVKVSASHLTPFIISLLSVNQSLVFCDRSSWNVMSMFIYPMYPWKKDSVG